MIRKIAFVVLLLFLPVFPEETGYNITNNTCITTADCKIGYCLGGVCVLPPETFCDKPASVPVGGECNATCQCVEGYCVGGKCSLQPVVECKDINNSCTATSECCIPLVCIEYRCTSAPTKTGGEVISPINIGVKSGCMGIAECTGGIGCFILCNFFYVLLVALSIVAGYIYYIRDKSRNRFIPILLVAIPIVIGALTYTLIGDIFALLIIIYALVSGESKQEIEI
ncbi:MAG: hypothetical protein QXP42_02700 [Candidatus Micrarchaeia archaeon]